MTSRSAASDLWKVSRLSYASGPMRRNGGAGIRLPVRYTRPTMSPLQPATQPPIALHPLPGLPEVLPGDDLAAFLCDAAKAAGVPFADGDMLVVAQKVVSKAEGARVALSSVTPSAKAEEWA